MRFSEDAERFLLPGGDRLVALGSLLSGLGLRYSVVKLGEARHVVMQAGKGKPRLALIAHYDRHPGSPGTLDNSCACLQLASFAARLSMAAGPGARAAGKAGAAAPILFVFTDAEEAPASGGADSQGSFALARALTAKGGALSALVLDVTGRGRRLVCSTAPAALLARNGMEDSPVAAGYRSLADFAALAAARAGLETPLAAELPWSDDLGLTLGGLPSLALSLLPEKELPLLAANRKPPTWELLHTAEDCPDKAEEGAFEVMAAFLDSLAACLSFSDGSVLY
jgi:Zn-dependent M28 family amino/carboxypeptidase